MTESEQGRTTLHFIVPRSDGLAILVQSQAEPGPLRLPERSIARGQEINAPIRAVADELLGSRVPLLRLAPINLTWDHGTADVVVETEAAASSRPPDGLVWRALAELDPAMFASEVIHPGVGRWLDEQRRGVSSSKRPVWSQRGFFTAASEWMTDRLAAAGTPLTGAPRLTQIWGISAFLQGETSTGKVFLKSCAAVFATEPQITLALDRAMPGVGPAVVAIEPVRRWLLMRDVGGTPLAEGPPELRPEGLVVFGRVQRAWPGAAARLPTEFAVELEDRTPAALAAMLPALFEDPVLDSLASRERDRLRAELPRFLERCARINDLGPLSTLVHGDFHPWNLHLDGERVSIIDWSDACIGHPFFDLTTFLGRTHDLAVRRVMLDAYLDGWSEGFERAALEEAALLGLALGSLHQVESYRRIVASLDPDDVWDLDQGAPTFVRRAFEWLDDGLAAAQAD